MAWWERKLQKGQECSHTDMTPNDWLQQELLRNVYDSELQRKLLQEREPKLARNLAIRQGMRFNPDSTLKIRAVNAQRLGNSGSVTFTLRYQGRSTEVNTLVSDAIKDEILQC